MRARLAQFEHELAASFVAGAARWVRPEQIHLTLTFLGDVPEESLSDLETALRRACQSSAPLELRADGLGCFPHPRNARVLWIGLLGDLDRLEKLHARVVEQTRNWSAPDPARPFQPHLTIARVKDLRLADRRRRAQRPPARRTTCPAAGAALILTDSDSSLANLGSTRLTARGRASIAGQQQLPLG